jgi:hypothetical protein
VSVAFPSWLLGGAGPKCIDLYWNLDFVAQSCQDQGFVIYSLANLKQETTQLNQAFQIYFNFFGSTLWSLTSVV